MLSKKLRKLRLFANHIICFCFFFSQEIEGSQLSGRVVSTLSKYV